MRDDLDPIGDAYRTLGLEPGASMTEVKRAYRLLAKAFHPDSAGEAAVPRFLAIHEAYDRLTTGRVPTGSRAARTGPAAPAEPWRADPARARQARERARTARGGAGRTRTSPNGPSGPSGSAAGSGSGSSGGATRGGTGTRGSGRRHVRKATMGSTSYDEARDVNDPTWSGASWYGPSSGEYWIVNPREYADPRKHGPEYQSRARRPLPGDAAGDEAATSLADTETSGPPTTAWTSPAPEAGAARPPRWGSSPSASSWSAPIDHRARAAGRAGDRLRVERARAYPSGERVGPRLGADRDPFDVEAAVGATGQAWLGGPSDDPIRRLGFALVAWPPIGLAVAAFIAEATGCASSTAGCTGTEPLLPWLAQALILGALLLLPGVARILAGGALGVLLTLVPFMVFLVAIGGAGLPQGGLALGALLGIAWLGGVAWAAMRARQSGPRRAGT